MRTLLTVSIGLALSVLFVFMSSTFGKGKLLGVALFLVGWLMFCVVDFLMGIKAGYSPVDELGIHILLFTLPRHRDVAGGPLSSLKASRARHDWE